MDAGSTWVFAIATMAAFHASEFVWVWYQVNRRGPIRARETVRAVLAEPASIEPLLLALKGSGMRGGGDPTEMRLRRMELEHERAATVKSKLLEVLVEKTGGLAQAKLAYSLIPDDLLDHVIKSGYDKWYAMLEPIIRKASLKAQDSRSPSNSYDASRGDR